MGECSLSKAISIGKDNEETIVINGFLAHYFKGYIDELEDCLIKIILSKQNHEPCVVNESIKKYCEVMANV